MIDFEFLSPVKLVFQRGGCAKIGEAVSSLGHRVLLVSGQGSMKRLGVLDRVEESCRLIGCEVFRFEGVEQNPCSSTVDRGAELAVEHGVDVFLAVGGGSAMDAAKAMSVVATHGGKIWDYMSQSRAVPGPVRPIVAVPSTSGTGSHVTPFAVIMNRETGEKPGLRHPNLYPKLSLIDLDLLLPMPPDVTAHTGIDVLTHAMESLFSKMRSPLTETHAWEAIRLVGLYLRRAVNHGEDEEARGWMSVADTHAGMALANAGVIIGHAMAHPISGRFPEIQHGYALAAVHPAVLDFLQDRGMEECKQIAHLLVPGVSRASAAFRQLLSDVGLKPSLASRGVTPEMVKDLVKNSLTTMAAAVSRNCIPVTPEDLERLYLASL